MSYLILMVIMHFEIKRAAASEKLARFKIAHGLSCKTIGRVSRQHRLTFFMQNMTTLSQALIKLLL